MSSTDHILVHSDESLKEKEYEYLLLEFHASDIKLPDESKKWDDFMIGQGGFANVYEVRIRNYDHDPSDETVEIYTRKAAFKKFKYKQLATDQEDDVLTKLKREASIVNQISHPNIIHLYGVCYDHQFFGLLLELCQGGSLGSVCRSIKKQNTIAIRVLASWAHQISSAMKYLTDRKYIHRDLKADNVLVKEPACFCSESETTPLDWCQICERRPLNKLQLKITDFGLSKTTMSVGNTIVGTLVWLAPEVFRQEKGDCNWTEFSDVWSFGVVLWEILAREMPHAGVHPNPVVVAVWNQDGQTLQLKESWPQKWKEIMTQCWSLDPSKRPRFETLVQYFEEYTKGLVEIHISDLPLEKKKRKKTLKFSLHRLKKSFEIPSNNEIGDAFTNRGKRNIQNRKRCYIAIGVSILTITLLTMLGFFLLKPSQPVITSVCSDGYVYYNITGFCYKTSVLPVTQKLATENCEDEGATLASVHSRAENTLILNLYNDNLMNYRHTKDVTAERSQVWIGGEYDLYMEDWVWSDGTPFSFDYWKYKEGLYNRYFWTVLHPELDGKWGINDQKKEAAFACKKPTRENEAKELALKNEPVIKDCAPNYYWLETTGFCYRIEFEPFTFDEAIQKCAEEHAHLVSIHSFSEHKEIVKLYKSKLADNFGDQAYLKRTYIWLGLTFDNSTESWSWTDGTSFNYSNWAPEYPLAPDMGYFWAILDIENDKPTKVILDDYRNMGPANYFAFICQKPDTSKLEIDVEVEKFRQKTKEVMKVDTTHRNCSSGFTYFEKTGYCYKSGTENVPFYLANRKCMEEENAHLVSVHSKEENDFVISLSLKNRSFRPERIYTGLYYTGNDWVWTDGSDVDYTNWQKGEPNFIFFIVDHGEPVVTISLKNQDDGRNPSNGKWISEKAKLMYGYVCKRRPD